MNQVLINAEQLQIVVTSKMVPLAIQKATKKYRERHGGLKIIRNSEILVPYGSLT